VLCVWGMFGVEGMLCGKVALRGQEPRGLLMLRGSRGCAPHLLLIWIKIGVSGILVCKRAFGSAKHVTLAVYLLFELTATYAYVC